MNYTIDLVNSWADKLVIRLLVLANTEQETIDKVIKGMIDKQNGVTVSDQSLSVPVKIFGINFKDAGTAIKTGLIIFAIITAIILYKRYSKR
jgi:hypothetical protein